MNSSSPPSFSDAQAAPTSSTGCLRRFALPPISVILVSILLFLLLNQVEISQAENPPPEPALIETIEGISPLFTPEVQAWEEKILIWSERYHLDPNLVATVMQIESCGYEMAKSGSGAMGLFQVMPFHFQDDENPYHPGTNARRGLKYLRMAQESSGEIKLTLAGYNGGIHGAQQPQEQWNDEMVRYVYWGYQIYQDANDGLTTSSRLTEWLNSGGNYLCQLAREQQ